MSISPSELAKIDPTSITDLKHVFARLRKPSKTRELGQSFLIDGVIRNIIIDAAELKRTDEVLEIGCGSGVLTQQLVKRAGRVVAIDVDPYLLELTRALAPTAELSLQDVRKIHLPNLFCEGRTDVAGDYLVVSNLPYYLTGYVLELLTTSACSPRRIVLTVQKEVAERMMGKPGARTMLSMSLEVFGTVQLVREISRRSFWPEPEVDSAVVRIDRHAKPVVAPEDRRAFLRVVKAGFAAKRKTLQNALAGGLHLTPPVVAELLKAVGLKPTARAQELTLDQWMSLNRALPKTAKPV